MQNGNPNIQNIQDRNLICRIVALCCHLRGISYSVHLETQFLGYIFAPCQPLLRVPKQGLTGGKNVPQKPSKADAIQKNKKTGEDLHLSRKSVNFVLS